MLLSLPCISFAVGLHVLSQVSHLVSDMKLIVMANFCTYV